MLYSKPPLSVSEQADRVIQRGMEVRDRARAERYIRHIGYYRLSAYWLPFEIPPPNGGPRTHQFLPGTDFDHIVDLYIFDRKLRLLIMEAIERVEVSVRTQWAGELAVGAKDEGRASPAHAHLDHGLFKDYRNHIKDLERLVREIEYSGEMFVQHYKDTYSEPGLPPIWACVETMSLGALSRWVQNTKQTACKKAIMGSLKLPTIEILEAVLHTLTPVRNVCAHHARLWNRRFPMTYPVIKRLRGRLQEPSLTLEDHHLFNHLVILDHLMTAIQPGTAWTRRLKDLLERRSDQELAWMGFPSNWRDRDPWRKHASVVSLPVTIPQAMP